jgi:hypothetical protein
VRILNTQGRRERVYVPFGEGRVFALLVLRLEDDNDDAVFDLCARSRFAGARRRRRVEHVGVGNVVEVFAVVVRGRRVVVRLAGVPRDGVHAVVVLGGDARAFAFFRLALLFFWV